MPNIKSQKDRVRLSAKQTARNKSARSALRTAVKKANASIEANADNKADTVKMAAVALEKAAGKGLIHRRTASRKVSRMLKKANAPVGIKQRKSSAGFNARRFHFHNPSLRVACFL